jgi:hypothetical protein
MIPDADRDALTRAIDALVDQYRGQCLWFLRPDCYPRTLEEQPRILDAIQRCGDRKASRKRPRPGNGSYGNPARGLPSPSGNPRRLG